MKNRLYVGNFPYTTSETELRALFAGFVVTDAKILTDRETQRSRGFGFVEVADAGQAEAAIAKLNGAQFGGRALVVSIARDKPARASRDEVDEFKQAWKS